MGTSRLKKLYDKRLQDEASKKREVQQDLAILSLQETVVKSIARLTEFLDGKVSKTVVVNQLKEIGTPDVQNVVEVLDKLHDTLKTHENTDLSGVIASLNNILEEAKKLPKDLPEIPQPIDHSEHFATLAKRLTDVEKAIRDQELHVEAPVVNVPETQVNVEAPNLTPLEKSNKELLKAVKAIVIPKYEPTDVTEIVKEQKKSNTYLKKILDKPTGGGFGGGGSSWVAVDENDIPVPIQLQGGAIPISGNPLSQYIIADEEETGTYGYTGFENASGGWYIQRETLASGAYRYAAGSSNYSTAWTGRAGQTYDYPSETF